MWKLYTEILYNITPHYSQTETLQPQKTTINTQCNAEKQVSPNVVSQEHLK